jgi:hypothetical protein
MSFIIWLIEESVGRLQGGRGGSSERGEGGEMGEGRGDGGGGMATAEYSPLY